MRWFKEKHDTSRYKCSFITPRIFSPVPKTGLAREAFNFRACIREFPILRVLSFQEHSQLLVMLTQYLDFLFVLSESRFQYL